MSRHTSAELIKNKPDRLPLATVHVFKNNSINTVSIVRGYMGGFDADDIRLVNGIRLDAVTVSRALLRLPRMIIMIMIMIGLTVYTAICRAFIPSFELQTGTPCTWGTCCAESLRICLLGGTPNQALYRVLLCFAAYSSTRIVVVVGSSLNSWIELGSEGGQDTQDTRQA